MIKALKLLSYVFLVLWQEGNSLQLLSNILLGSSNTTLCLTAVIICDHRLQNELCVTDCFKMLHILLSRPVSADVLYFSSCIQNSSFFVSFGCFNVSLVFAGYAQRMFHSLVSSAEQIYNSQGLGPIFDKDTKWKPKVNTYSSNPMFSVLSKEYYVWFYPRVHSLYAGYHIWLQIFESLTN